MDEANKETAEEAPKDLAAMLEAMAKSIAETEIEQFPVVGLDRESSMRARPGGNGPTVGSMVKIRPCAAEYEGKTFLGVYLGTFAIDAFVARKKGTEERKIVCNTNPAILVPALKKVIFGVESFWGPIKDEAELRAITDSDIDSLWYVQALKAQAAATQG